VGRSRGFLVECLLQNLVHYLFRDLRHAAGARGIFPYSFQAEDMESAAPQGDGVGMGVEGVGYVFVLETVSGLENDLGPQDQAVGCRPPVGPPGKLVTLVGGEYYSGCNTHELPPTPRYINISIYVSAH
jgi:hypothetical protein